VKVRLLRSVDCHEGRAAWTPHGGAGVLAALARQRERRRHARVRLHANGQTSAASTPAPPPPRVPGLGHALWLVTVAVAVALAAPAALAATPTRSTARLAGSFTDVHLLAEGADADFFYKTYTSLNDCGAHRAEMPIVWHEHVRGRLADAGWTRVTLFPEEPSRRSASFTFQLDESGAWRADAPCQVTIAP
jgi:hypothetical protein